MGEEAKATSFALETTIALIEGDYRQEKSCILKVRRS